MSASSIKRFTLPRRVVASSGIAAALFVAGPVAVATADDATSTTSDSSTTGEVSTETAGEEDGGTDALAETSLDDGSTTDSEDTDDAGGAPGGSEIEPAAASNPPVAPEPTPAVSAASEPSEAAEPVAPPPLSNFLPPASSSEDSAENSLEEDPADESSDEPVDTHEPLPDPLVDHTTPPAFQVTLDAGEVTAASDQVISAAEPLIEVDGDGSVFYQLIHGTGTEGLILFNQSAMMLGVLSRRGRGSGQDYAALLGPGERGFLPARVITEGSLGKHAWDDEAGTVDLSTSTLKRFFDRALVTLQAPTDLSQPTVAESDAASSAVFVTSVAAAEDDPDNRFLDPSDADWAAGWADNVDATPPPGTSYSVGEDGSVTIHNDSDVDIAVISPYHGMWSDQGLTVIRPGQAYTIPETQEDSSAFNAYWVQSERREGQAVVIAQVITAGGQVVVAPAAEGHPEQSRWLPLHGTTPVDVEGIDPGDRFLDPGDYLAPGGSNLEPSYGNPETAGVNYSVVDDDHIRIHNDGTGAIAVTQSTPGGQLLGFDVLAPGESKVYGTVPGGHAIVSVQAERSADGKPVLLGGVGTSPIDGTIAGTAPYDGYPAIPLRDTPLPENHAPTGEVVAQPKPADQRERVYTVNGFDIDGDTLTFSIHTPPSRGTLVDNGDGTFTYTPTNPDDLHEGSVNDQFLIEISDGRGGTALAPGFVFYSFENVNEEPLIESVTGGQDAIGNGAWFVVISDSDGDPIGVSGYGRPTFGTVTAQQVFSEPDPVTGVSTAVPGQYIVNYVPDLERAHEGAYDDQFTLTFSDGHGGTVSETITVQVPLYNQNPYGSAHPTGDSPILDQYGEQVGTITNGPEYVLELELHDDDGDAVTVSSVSTSNGGTALLRDGFVIYTPKPSVDGRYVTTDQNGNVRYDYVYYDTITVTIEDVLGGTSTTTAQVLVVDTSSLPWVLDSRGDILMVTPGTDAATDIVRAMRYRDDDAYVDLIAVLIEHGITGSYAADFAELRSIADQTGLTYQQVRMLQDWADDGIDLLGVLLGTESAIGLIKQINAFREVQDAAQQRRLAAFVAPTLRQVADSNPLIREQYFARTEVTDRLWNLTRELRGGIAASTRVGLRALGPVGTVVGAGLVIHDFATAETPRDYAHASVDAAATALPVIGLVGCAFGPLGCVVGVAVGSAAGFGLSGGNAVARTWWDTMESETSTQNSSSRRASV
ncbi:Ig-like domain-containing protein [Gordonia sp. HS-NH1]|uniref:Ig-like domain-containing protein n=1 Tax=Gordonia sp. HS-NH1 TaxID=1435068 RepID=UPI0006E37D36|nr:Ig-like domain-containing protein [Gordonia sp. HS-NH1]